MTQASARKRILVIDDEPDLRTLYELALMKQGYEVITQSTFGGAKMAVEGASYDAIISDMRLPDGLGIDLLPILTELGRSERCIIVTAYGSQDGAVDALKAGAFDYLSKPVDMQQLRSVVAAAVAEKEHAQVPTAPAHPTSAADTHTPAQTNLSASAPSATTPTITAPQTPQAAAAPSTHATVTTNTTDLGTAALQRIVGCSASMQAVRDRIAKVARGMAPVFIHGESGTGKELVANAVHACSQRASGPFVPVNCGAIPENLIEAEFFGARKGAYTGATTDREGVFQAAAGGTLFLDEIGDLPLAMQAKLLRAIQERKVRPLGDTQEIAVDVRIVSATHHDLAANVQAGLFRQDLFYRLNVIDITLPPLRQRREDLPFLCQALLAKLTAQSNFTPKPLSQHAMMQLMQHPLPGNVRELENLLQRALALSDGDELQLNLGAVAHAPNSSTNAPVQSHAPLSTTQTEYATPAPTAASSNPAKTAHSLADLAQQIPDGAGLADIPTRALTDDGEPRDPLPRDLQAYLDHIERDILVRALREYDFNRTAAAEHLGISLRQMRYRIKQLDINENDCR